MTLLVLIRIAARNLVRGGHRTVLLMAAISVVTALLVLLLALAQGIHDNLVRTATTLSAGHVVVGGFYKPTAGMAAPLVTKVPEVRRIIEENTPGLDYIVERNRGWGKVVSDTASLQAGIQGIHIGQEDRFLSVLQMAEEREYLDGGRAEVLGDPRRLAQPHTALLFANQAKRLEVGVGDTVTIQIETSGGRTNTMDSTVVAVARDMGLLSSWVVVIPVEDNRELYQLNDESTGALWVYLEDIRDADQVMRHLREVFTEHGFPLLEHQPLPFWAKFETVTGEDWTGQKLDLTTWEDEVSFLTWVLTAFRSVSWFVVVILVALIAVGITNAMYNAVRERTREIGTMRAIGMTRRRVLGMVLLEAAILGLAASSLGALVGTALALGIDAAAFSVPIDAMKTILLSDTVHLSLQPATLLSAVFSLTIYTAAAALWPAFRAARMRPVTAIQHIE